MAGMVTGLANSVLDLIYRQQPMTPPPGVFLGLLVSAPGPDGVGGSELSASGYQRQAVAFAPAVDRAIVNGAEIVFTAEAPEAWGTLNLWALFDAPTGGAVMHWDRIDPRLVVDAGWPVIIEPGQLRIDLPAVP